MSFTPITPTRPIMSNVTREARHVNKKKILGEVQTWAGGAGE